jgi:hypothetical protein
VVTTLWVASVEAFVQAWSGLPGQPPCGLAALARAFMAKAVIGPPTTSMLESSSRRSQPQPAQLLVHSGLSRASIAATSSAAPPSVSMAA